MKRQAAKALQKTVVRSVQKLTDIGSFCETRTAEVEADPAICCMVISCQTGAEPVILLVIPEPEIRTGEHFFGKCGRGYIVLFAVVVCQKHADEGDVLNADFRGHLEVGTDIVRSFYAAFLKDTVQDKDTGIFRVRKKILQIFGLTCPVSR